MRLTYKKMYTKLREFVTVNTAKAFISGHFFKCLDGEDAKVYMLEQGEYTSMTLSSCMELYLRSELKIGDWSMQSWFLTCTETHRIAVDCMRPAIYTDEFDRLTLNLYRRESIPAVKTFSLIDQNISFEELSKFTALEIRTLQNIVGMCKNDSPSELFINIDDMKALVPDWREENSETCGHVALVIIKTSEAIDPGITCNVVHNTHVVATRFRRVACVRSILSERIDVTEINRRALLHHMRSYRYLDDVSLYQLNCAAGTDVEAASLTCFNRFRLPYIGTSSKAVIYRSNVEEFAAALETAI